MDKRLKKLVNDFTKKFGLEHYHLETHSFYQKNNFDGKTHYTCTMELIPSVKRDEIDEDFNPPGTAVIDYNLTTKKLVSILFVHGVSYATKTIFHDQTVQEVANWIENETGYRYETDFFVADTIDNGYVFKVEINGIMSSPEGIIEIEFDDDGKLTSFTMQNIEVLNEKIAKEEFTLTLDQIAPIIKDQVQLIHFPNEETAEFIPFYRVDEVYITNDGKRLIPYLEHEREEISIHKQIQWTTSLEGSIEQKVINPSLQIPIEVAFSIDEPPMKPKIPVQQVPEIIRIVTDLLRTVQPDHSSKWTLESIRRDEHFIEVICIWNETKPAYFNRKFIALIDPETLEILNYIDNGELLEILKSFTPAAKAMVTQEEAYEKLFPSIRLTPKYVYDLEMKQFQLCGLLNTTDWLHAVTGETIELY